GYTIQGARQQLQELRQQAAPAVVAQAPEATTGADTRAAPSLGSQTPDTVWQLAIEEMIGDLEEIAQMLSRRG
ncbi:MAG: hypothetical protein VW625_08410, partial [Perlucidibaca sp.]